MTTIFLGIGLVLMTIVVNLRLTAFMLPGSFSKIVSAIKGEKVELVKKFFPKEHQKIAVQKTLNHFNNYDRGQLILPCGTGKTLTSLWIKEKIN